MFDNEMQDTAANNISDLFTRVTALESIGRVGGSSPLFGTAFVPAINTVTNTYLATVADCVILADANGGAFDVDLPAVASFTGYIFVIKKIDATANAVTIDPDGAETIDGAGSLALSSQYDSATVVSDGSEWFAIGVYP